jgi:hypothetical protein
VISKTLPFRSFLVNNFWWLWVAHDVRHNIGLVLPTFANVSVVFSTVLSLADFRQLFNDALVWALPARLLSLVTGHARTVVVARAPLFMFVALLALVWSACGNEVGFGAA